MSVLCSFVRVLVSRADDNGRAGGEEEDLGDLMVNEYVAIPELLRRQDQRLSSGAEGNFGFVTRSREDGEDVAVVEMEEVAVADEVKHQQEEEQEEEEQQEEEESKDDGECLTLIMRACLEHEDHRSSSCPPSSPPTTAGIIAAGTTAAGTTTTTSLHHARDVQRRTDDLRERLSFLLLCLSTIEDLQETDPTSLLPSIINYTPIC